jgi:adenosyl cobinamide kinase/adenosyl cobinamide phosphate guanylyltransferase
VVLEHMWQMLEEQQPQEELMVEEEDIEQVLLVDILEYLMEHFLLQMR